MGKSLPTVASQPLLGNLVAVISVSEALPQFLVCGEECCTCNVPARYPLIMQADFFVAQSKACLAATKLAEFLFPVE